MAGGSRLLLPSGIRIAAAHDGLAPGIATSRRSGFAAQSAPNSHEPASITDPTAAATPWNEPLDWLFGFGGLGLTLARKTSADPPTGLKPWPLSFQPLANRAAVIARPA